MFSVHQFHFLRLLLHNCPFRIPAWYRVIGRQICEVMEQQNVSENKNNSNDKQKQPDYIINTHIFCVNIKQGKTKNGEKTFAVSD